MDKLVKAIIDITKNDKQLSLFDSNDTFESDLIKACIELLKDRGYSIINPKTYSFKGKIKKIDDLISLFYDALDYYNTKAIYRKNIAIDRHIAKLFVESRMNDAGLGKTAAMEECAEIILCFCKNIMSFGLKRDTVDFSVFGQDKSGWITNKAIDILNEQHHKKTLEKIENLSDVYKDESSRFDIDELLLEEE